ncbi:Predicted secreted protein [Halopseudomonas xinjiangensis]|uniref:Predicted secreted protein n=1 Tax=Halopseudomonas xinjiangensis TaxID=487184 RepID=A0A1H1LGV4_9GAMM|nr:SIMPL domain-containing protein [Halopseudomonas xinjiangensis]SDR73255.1 Predicted secreted protein [Halopseudomonas xinjiangensis]
MRQLSMLGCLLALSLAGGQAMAEEPRYNQVSLRAEVERSVSHDTMRVILFTEDQHEDPATLAERITRQLNESLKTARNAPGVTVSSGNRSSHPVYDEKGQNIVAWRERGEIILEGTDFAALSKLTGQLLGSLRLASMDFSLSPGSRRNTEDELIKEAVKAFRSRADIATEALGGNSYKIVSLNLNTQYAPPPMMFRGGAKLSMASDREMSAPSVEGGQADVTVSADGTIEVSTP